MRTEAELLRRLEGHEGGYLYEPEVGYIAWAVGTGGNYEIMYVGVVEQGQGHGLTLFKKFAASVLKQGRRPYHSVYLFRLASNVAAGKFYRKLGWHEQVLDYPDGPGRTVYGGDGTVVMWIAWEDLLRNLGLS